MSTPRKKLAILGSTGVIGKASLQVADHCSDRIQVTALVAGKQTALLAKQIQKYGCHYAKAIHNDELKTHLNSTPCNLLNEDELCEFVASSNVDILLCAIVGTSGLRPVLAALKAGKTIALASKEILVMAGQIVHQYLKQYGGKLLPVDSEHCAIFQCMDKQEKNEVQKIILTASGGPFHATPELNFDTVTIEQALKHPTWTMGPKITFDSASLMNKGLEMIEARWLFDLQPAQIEVVIHPQSIVHSMVEFIDSSILAQLGVPDMKLPIQYCLDYPHRHPSLTPALDFTSSRTLTFTAPDIQRFPSLRLARNVMENGGPGGAIFNAANEIAVEKFCKSEIHFSDIFKIVEKTLERCVDLPGNTLEEIIESDHAARRIAKEL